ncbi:MAG: ureidoglycolate lyase [Pigmentiphaga sp.]|uniref:ureidoglycolate lyase n=1 Tax=Pigmentiphaga sp. TaxID=1977564 RepID=UPI0029BEDF0D|nr:ureidoglycolate lyase [Pigmentiphaga sp.]MDX3904846.1 ureidoglycolate lyase [Pigmentiphaga sp.]
MHTSPEAEIPASRIELPLERITAERFRPYGTLIEATEDGVPFGPHDARLVLDRGTPRFYIMNLHRRPPRFRHITRHLSVTQCLASVGGKPWFIAVAPPDSPDDAQALPDAARIRAFRVEGDQAIMLARGTWHAGPFFDTGDTLAFFNLELADTNVVDHHTVRLDHVFGYEFAFAPAP